MITNSLLGNMATVEFENHLRERRLALGFSQKRLAEMAGITRQAVAAVETDQYCPATSVALQLARTLQCRVEDLFSLPSPGDIVEAELASPMPPGPGNVRAQVAQVGERLVVQPLDGSGELASLGTTADGFIVGQAPSGGRVKVQLSTKPGRLRDKIVIAGCDPAMFLAAEHLRLHGGPDILPRMMGSGMALTALKHRHVHAAGVHLTGASSSGIGPAVKRQLAGLDCVVVTFAHWEEGFLIRRNNPKRIRSVADLARPGITVVNREPGSGARRLLDRQLDVAGIPSGRLKGYRTEVLSHLEVASRVASGLADVGIGVRAAATIRALDFIPLQRERYDLIIPRAHYESLPGFMALLDTIVGAPFRNELEALGGYDTRESGRIVSS